MKHFFRDTGIVIRKRQLQKDNRLITILSEKNGKINLVGYGIRSLLSKRLSHVETGNYISFSYYKKNEYYSLGETDLIWAFSKIKKSEPKLNLLFLLFFILDKIMPENQTDEAVFEKTRSIMTKLNNREQFTFLDLSVHLKELLIMTGFIDDVRSQSHNFNVLEFIENLIDRKIKWAYLDAV